MPAKLINVRPADYSVLRKNTFVAIANIVWVKMIDFDTKNYLDIK